MIAAPKPQHPERRDTLAGWLWVSPWVAGFLMFLLVPVLMSLYFSFTDYPLLEPPLWTGASNYTRMFHDDVFLGALRKTLIYAAVSIPLSTALALVIAGLLNARVRAEGFFQAAVFVPTLVPMAASAMIWLWLLNGEHGLINRALRTFGIEGPNWLTDPSWAMPALVLISLWGVGQAVVVYLAALKEVPEQLYEAAAIDGMSPLRRFWSITLPMISPVILFNVITLMIGTMQFFVVPYIITKATPGSDPRAMYFFTMYLYDNAFVYGHMGYACAQAWVQLLIILALTGAMFALGKRFVHYRGA